VIQRCAWHFLVYLNLSDDTFQKKNLSDEFWDSYAYHFRLYPIAIFSFGDKPTHSCPFRKSNRSVLARFGFNWLIDITLVYLTTYVLASAYNITMR
jgi:hypothetical protein